MFNPARIYNFFQSQLGLLVISTVLLPLFVYSYHLLYDLRKQGADRAIELRITIYRMELVLKAAKHQDYNHFRRAYEAIQGDWEFYKPMYPDLEGNLPLNGLLFRLADLDSLLEGELSPLIDLHQKLVDDLLPLVGPQSNPDKFNDIYPLYAERIKKIFEKLPSEYIHFKRISE